MRRIIGGFLVVAVFFAGTLWAMDMFWPAAGPVNQPTLTELPPLQPVTRTSLIVAPTSIPLLAIRTAMEANAPRDLSGKAANPVSDLLSKAEIGVTVTRGAISVIGRQEAMTISTPVSGTLRVTGKIGTETSKLSGSLGGLINTAVGREVQGLTGRMLNQGADVRGNVTITARPALTPEWRLDPNLAAQVNVGEGALSIAGMKLNVSNEVKPLLDKEVNQQITALQTRLRNDPFIETAARREWAKMCRSIPLGGASGSMPDLWLEIRPTRAFTARPRIDAMNLILTVGVETETRVAAAASKPICPFPERLDVVSHSEQGRIAIGLPIDVPFTEISELLEAQLKGRSFPEDGSGPVDIVVQHARVAASGDRLLVSLRVKAREKKSWFGFGAEADVHIWGRPVLDREQQTLKLTDIETAVESEAAFGLLGTAARAAMPYLQQALAKNSVIDLKPFAANASKKIGAAIAEFDRGSEDMRIDAAINSLRLVDLAFDSKTLRVIAEVGGTVRVAISRLAGL